MTIRALMFSFCAISAIAATSIAQAGMYRAGGKVLGTGDPVSKVTEVMGQPSSKEQVLDSYNTVIGQYWYYTVGNKTVRFYVNGGRVLDVIEIR